MAVADLVSAWLLPFVAPIILYFVRQYAIHRGWLKEPSLPSSPSDGKIDDAIGVLVKVHKVLEGINENISGQRKELAGSLIDIKGSLDRLKELSEAHERDGGMLIYQRVPTPHVSSAAVHLDG